MDTGLAIFLSSLSPPLSVLVAYLWGRHEVRVAATAAADQLAKDRARLAFQLSQHDTEVATKLAENTALTQETKDKTEQTYHEITNGMKDALVKTEKTTSETKDLVLEIEQRRIEEKERADQVKKR